MDHLLESYLENKVPISKKKMRSNVPKPTSEGNKIHLWNVNSEEGKALGVKGTEMAAFLEYRDQRQDLSLKGRKVLEDELDFTRQVEDCKEKALCVTLRYINALVYFAVG